MQLMARKKQTIYYQSCVKDRNKSDWEKLFRFGIFIVFLNNNKMWDIEKPELKCLWQPRMSDVLSFVVEVNMNFDYRNILH